MKNIVGHFDRLEETYRIGYLIGGFIQKTLTREEEEELDYWLLESEENMQLFEDITDEKTIDSFLKWYATRDTEANLLAVKTRIRFPRRNPFVRLMRFAATAVIIGMIGLCIYLFSSQEKKTYQAKHVSISKDILPGSSFAILKLPGNHAIRLAGDTVISDQLYVKDGQLIYRHLNEVSSLAFHEVWIPRKGSFKLLLPDGTRVWMNAESSIRYPSGFTGPDRRITVTGETYFEVARDKRKPFIVDVNSTEIKALGTKFNINAYANEPAQSTTLIEGSISVSRPDKRRILKPGEQVRIVGEEWSVTNSIDTMAVTGWINNQISFENASIEDVMRQVERWYDAKVIYADKVNLHFNGTIGRDMPLSRFLQLMEKTGQVHFTLNGNQLIVRK